jgi:hypothetical protein
MADDSADDRADEFLSGPNRGCSCEKCRGELAEAFRAFARERVLAELEVVNAKWNSLDGDAAKFLCWFNSHIETQRIKQIEAAALKGEKT